MHATHANPPPIPPPRTLTVIAPAKPTRKLKVAAYCRVSTTHADQLQSLEAQQRHFATLVATHPSWELAEIYHDRTSGTQAHTRPNLQRMLGDCACGRIDIVLAKSISRLARNTTDLLEIIRQLHALHIRVIFERESIDTARMDSEFLLTVLGSLAEDESRSISANCRWGIQRRFESGSYRPARAPYGYDLVDGSFVVNEREASVVRRIYQHRIEGWSLARISSELNQRGIPSKCAGQIRAGREVSGMWSASVVRRLITNEAYLGNLMLQKTYRDQQFKSRPNHGELPRYRVRGHHQALVSQRDFDLANGQSAKKPQLRQVTTE